MGGLEAIRATLERRGVDALIPIGGEDTLGVALLLHEEGIPIVGVPKTIDNDLGGTDVTFGFNTAVQIVTDAIDRLHTTAESHNRVMVVEVMGRHAGWIATHAGIAGGADAILVPERPFDVEEVCAHLRRRHERGRTFSIVVVAEGATPREGTMQTVRSDATDTFSGRSDATDTLVRAPRRHRRPHPDAATPPTPSGTRGSAGSASRSSTRSSSAPATRRASRSSATCSAAAPRPRSTACSPPASASPRCTPSPAAASARWSRCTAPDRRGRARPGARGPQAARPRAVRDRGAVLRLTRVDEPESQTMRAMVFEEVGQPLRAVERPIPVPAPGQLLLKVHACGVCRTDLHLLDGEVADRRPAADPRPPDRRHRRRPTGAASASPGWGGPAASAPTAAPAARTSARARASPAATSTAAWPSTRVADERFCFEIPPGYPDAQAAPLLCAGLIGYRALRMAGARGASACTASAPPPTSSPRSPSGRDGACSPSPAPATSPRRPSRWSSAPPGPAARTSRPPEPLDAAIIFAPDGALVPLALRALAPGGTVVCGGIHMSDIPSFPYADLWEERTIRSVANLTRRDAEEFLALAPRVPVKTQVTAYPLEDANGALADLRAGRFTGAAVLTV